MLWLWMRPQTKTFSAISLSLYGYLVLGTLVFLNFFHLYLTARYWTLTGHDHLSKKLKILWFLFYGSGSTTLYKATVRRQSTFYHKSSEIPFTHLIDLGRMKDWFPWLGM